MDGFAVGASLVSVILGAALAWWIGRQQQPQLLAKLKDVLKDRWRVGLTEEFALSQLLAEKIAADKFRPDVIFAISPGGGMVAEWLEREALAGNGLPTPIRSINVQIHRSSGAGTADKVMIHDDPAWLTEGLPPTSTVLLVNDVSRGGMTMDAAYKLLTAYFDSECVKTATLFYHAQSHFHPTYYSVKTEQSVHFDWKES
jgi:hypoxanthine phosphoribosyltransferase